METTKRPIVADPDTAFLQKIFYSCRASATPPLVVNSAEKLEEILGRDCQAISSVFLNPRLTGPKGGKSLGVIREHLPNAPLFYIIEEAMQTPAAEDLKNITISDCLKKPFSYLDLERALNQSLMQFSNKPQIFSEGKNQPRHELDEPDEDFCPLRARNFQPGKEIFFDLYIKIKKGRYLKILLCGDVFSQERLDQYLEKNVEYFFIRRKMKESYLEYCDKVTDALLASPKVSAEVKSSQLLNMGEQTAQFLRENGVQEPAINYALQFARKSLDLSLQMVGRRDESIIRHLKDAVNFDHSVSVTMVSSLLATHLNFDRDRAVRIVGLAAMLHDVGMVHISKEIQNVDPSLLTCEDLDIYEAHPLIGQEMLGKIPGIEPVVIQAVGQHHERRDGRGFPNQLKSGGINIVAEIIGVSEEFIQLLLRAQKNPAIQVMKKMETKLNGFSHSTASSFRYFFGKRP